MIYIYTFLASVFFAYLAEHSKHKDMIILYSAISILIPSILGGLRAYGVGTDTYTYGRPDALQALRSANIIDFIMNNRCELGYKILVYFTAPLFENENGCYFFQQLVTISGIYVGAWRHRKILSVPFTMFAFYCMQYSITYNAIRQSMAGAVIFMGLNYLEQRKYVKFLPYVVIATSFHSSAFVLSFLILGIYIITASEFLSNHQRTKKFIAYMTLALIPVAKDILLIIVSGISFLSVYARFVTNMADTEKIFNSMALILSGEVLLTFMYHKGAARTYSKIGLYNLEFHRYNAIFVVLYMFFVRFYSFRVLTYQEILNIFLLSSLPNFIKEKNLKIMMYVFLILILLFFWWLCFVYHGSQAVWPYRSIL